MSPASVTTSDGSPSLATHHPCTSPASVPTAMAMTIASEERHRPPSCSFASTAALRPIVDATDRSISPDTMTNVIITAMITFSIDSWNRLTRLLTPR